MANNGTMGGRVRIAAVGDGKHAQTCLNRILGSGRNFELAGRFSSGGEALTALPQLHPHVALVAQRLQDMDGLELARRLEQVMPRLTVVILSDNRRKTSSDHSIDAGAAGYLIKPLFPDQLPASLWFAVCSANRAPGMQPRKVDGSKTPSLTPRELAVLHKLVDGLLYKEISEALGISYAAVHKSQHRIFRKLHVSNRTELARVASTIESISSANSLS